MRCTSVCVTLRLVLRVDPWIPMVQRQQDLHLQPRPRHRCRRLQSVWPRLLLPHRQVLAALMRHHPRPVCATSMSCLRLARSLEVPPRSSQQWLRTPPRHPSLCEGGGREVSRLAAGHTHPVCPPPPPLDAHLLVLVLVHVLAMVLALVQAQELLLALRCLVHGATALATPACHPFARRGQCAAP